MKEIYPLSRMHFGSVLDACWDFFYHTYRADCWGNNRPFGRRVPAALSQENGESENVCPSMMQLHFHISMSALFRADSSQSVSTTQEIF